MHATALLACLAGFAALALAVERQQHDVFGRSLAATATRRLRVAGWALLALALAVLVRGQGWGLALVGFSGHTSAAAGLVYLALIVRQRRARRHTARNDRRDQP